jgi:prepilin-type N-terminal cleavage/methylation domain-containing protein
MAVVAESSDMRKVVKLTDRSGFSLLEIVIVLAIMLVIAAYALPNVMSAISDYRLRNTISQVGALYQQQRMVGVQTNSVATIPDAATVNGRTIAYIDRNNNSQYDGGEPMVEFPNKISVVKSGAPTFASSLVNYTPQLQSTYIVRFNARGLPCLGTPPAPCVNLDISTTPPKPIGFLIYFKNDKSFGQTGWGAITITPGGRIKTWFYNGSTYEAM